MKLTVEDYDKFKNEIAARCFIEADIERAEYLIAEQKKRQQA